MALPNARQRKSRPVFEKKERNGKSAIVGTSPRALDRIGKLRKLRLLLHKK